MSLYVKLSNVGRVTVLCVLPCISYYAYRVLHYPSVVAGINALFDERRLWDDHASQAQRLQAKRMPLTAHICLLVSLIRESLDRHHAPLITELYSTLGPSVVLPMIEMSRAGYRTSWTLACMLMLGVMHQSYFGGVILPLWWAAHLLISGRRTVPLHPHCAEAMFLGYFLGYLVVSVAMVVYRTDIIIRLWQLFPAYTTLVQALYLAYQHGGADDVPDCSYEVLQLIHVTNFCWSAITHAYTLFQAFSSHAPLSVLKHAFYPEFSPEWSTRYPALGQQILKWDVLFVVCSTLFAGIWLLRGIRPRTLAFAWFVLGSLCFGMGAGISGVWMWREKVLEEKRRANVAQARKRE